MNECVNELSIEKETCLKRICMSHNLDAVDVQVNRVSVNTKESVIHDRQIRKASSWPLTQDTYLLIHANRVHDAQSSEIGIRTDDPLRVMTWTKLNVSDRLSRTNRGDLSGSSGAIYQLASIIAPVYSWIWHWLRLGHVIQLFDLAKPFHSVSFHSKAKDVITRGWSSGTRKSVFTKFSIIALIDDSKEEDQRIG